MFFLFDVGPLFSSALLVLVHALLEFLIPNVSRGDVHRIAGKLQCHALGEDALSRALSASY